MNTKEYSQRYYQKHKDHIKIISNAYRKSRPEYYLWQNAKHRAIRHGIPFSLSINDIVIPPVCPVFKTKMIKPSIDRFDNTKGYTKDNIRIISNRANTLKNNGTIEQFILLLKYLNGED